MNAELPAIRADLLVELERIGAVTATELRLPRGLPLERVEALAAMLGQLGSSVRWWCGDLLLYLEDEYGVAAAQLSEALNLSPEGRQEYLRVALAFNPSRRRASLSWSHHRALAGRWLQPRQREQLLDAAEAERLSVRELGGQVEALRERLEGEGSLEAKAAARPWRRRRLSARGSDSLHVQGGDTDCEQVVEHALAELRADLLACGFDGAGLTLAVEVSAGAASFRTSLGEEAA